MRWNQLANDLPRAAALADILCGAASADGHVAHDERVVVSAMLMKVLGVSELPAEVEARVMAFDPRAFDLDGALAQLALTTDRDRRSLAQVVKDIVEVDAHVADAERAFVARLDALLGAR